MEAGASLSGGNDGGSVLKTIVGIDPGDTGAIVAIHPDGQIDFHDTPVVVEKTKRPRKRGSDPSEKDRYKTKTLLDYPVFAGILASYPDAVFGVEHLQPRSANPSGGGNVAAQGGTSSSNYKAGVYTGAVQGCLAALGKAPLPAIRPEAWMKGVGAIGMSHEEYRQLALKLYPQCAHELRLKKHHGRAAALLIAHYVKSKFAAEVAA
jgi:hypothetical protein